jgi:hypothetical protein
MISFARFKRRRNNIEFVVFKHVGLQKLAQKGYKNLGVCINNFRTHLTQDLIFVSDVIKSQLPLCFR